MSATRRGGRRGGAAPRVALPGASARVQVPQPSPALARDPWAWACLLAIVPLLVRCAGARLGEPVAEDFDFLRRSLFHGVGSLLDGGGSQAFWRPIPHQLYYAALGPLMLAHPRAIAVLHVLLLAAATVLVHRALRSSLGGPVACLAATFPALSESTRTLVSWPSQFVTEPSEAIASSSFRRLMERCTVVMLVSNPPSQRWFT